MLKETSLLGYRTTRTSIESNLKPQDATKKGERRGKYGTTFYLSCTHLHIGFAIIMAFNYMRTLGRTHFEAIYKDIVF